MGWGVEQGAQAEQGIHHDQDFTEERSDNFHCAVGRRKNAGGEDCSSGDKEDAKTNRGQSMRNVRRRMELSRKKKNVANHDLDIVVEEGCRLAKTSKGRKLLRSQDVPREKVQDRSSPMVIVGSDVEALYPSLEDIKVAEICYNAVMKTKIKFDNIDYLEAT